MQGSRKCIKRSLTKEEKWASYKERVRSSEGDEKKRAIINLRKFEKKMKIPKMTLNDPRRMLRAGPTDVVDTSALAVLVEGVQREFQFHYDRSRLV